MTEAEGFLVTNGFSGAKAKPHREGRVLAPRLGGPGSPLFWLTSPIGGYPGAVKALPSRVADMDEGSSSILEPTVACRIIAEWRWPEVPLARVRVDDREVAVVDYLPASAAAHWYLRWTSSDCGADGPDVLPLMALVTRVPEEVDGDDDMRANVLDTALEAVANRLAGRVVGIDPHDL
jgi:hypothetical protein